MYSTINLWLKAAVKTPYTSDWQIESHKVRSNLTHKVWFEMAHIHEKLPI